MTELRLKSRFDIQLGDVFWWRYYEHDGTLISEAKLRVTKLNSFYQERSRSVNAGRINPSIECEVLWHANPSKVGSTWHVAYRFLQKHIHKFVFEHS